MESYGSYIPADGSARALGCSVVVFRLADTVMGLMRERALALRQLPSLVIESDGGVSKIRFRPSSIDIRLALYCHDPVQDNRHTLFARSDDVLRTFTFHTRGSHPPLSGRRTLPRP